MTDQLPNYQGPLRRNEMANERFRIAKGRMMVIAPGQAAEMKPCLLIVDIANGSVGVQILDDQLKGYTIFVKEAIFAEVKTKGKPTDELRIA